MIGHRGAIIEKTINPEDFPGTSFAFVKINIQLADFPVLFCQTKKQVEKSGDWGSLSSIIYRESHQSNQR